MKKCLKKIIIATLLIAFAPLARADKVLDSLKEMASHGSLEYTGVHQWGKDCYTFEDKNALITVAIPTDISDAQAQSCFQSALSSALATSSTITSYIKQRQETH
jgi:hypothetical protein